MTYKQKEHTCWFGIFVECVELLGSKGLVEVILDDTVDGDSPIEVLGCTVTTVTFGCPDIRVLYDTVTCPVLQALLLLTY
jgi:hypothetical protein